MQQSTSSFPAGKANEPWVEDVSTPGEIIHTVARIILLEEGLQALTISAIASAVDLSPGVALPGVNVSPWPSDNYDLAEIVASSSDFAGWVTAEGGTVVVKVPRGGGVVAVTSYGIARKAAPPHLHVQRLDQPTLERKEKIAVAPIPAKQRSGEIPIEMTLHIERQGDCQLSKREWFGDPGRRLRLEAFAVRPLEAIALNEIEYMAFGPDGRQTTWVSNAKLCGTRGRGLPLTGFAVRLVPHLRERFDVVYEGSFFETGIIGPVSNGEPCLPSITNDRLEAIKLRIVEQINT